MQKNCSVYIQRKSDIVVVDIKQHKSQFKNSNFTIIQSAWCSGNASDPISEVTVCRARLILRWVTVREQVNHLGM